MVTSRLALMAAAVCRRWGDSCRRRKAITWGSAPTRPVSSRSSAEDRLPSASEAVCSSRSSSCVTHCCKPSGHPAQKLRRRAVMRSASTGNADSSSGRRSIRSVACRITCPTSTAPSAITSASSASVSTAARKPRFNRSFRRASVMAGSISAAKPSASKNGSSHTSA